MKRFLRYTTAIIATSYLAGCKVGPDYKRPDLPKGMDYQSTPLTNTSGRGTNAFDVSQHFQTGVDVPGKWWELFQNPVLNSFVEQALAHNQSLAGMQAGLKSAWEQRRIEGAGLYPTVSASFNPTRNKTSKALSPVPNSNLWLYSMHTAQLNIGYVPDLWGGVRRAIEAASAQAEIQRFQLEATAITLISNIVSTTINEASIRAQISATEDLIASQKETLNTLKARQRLGDASLQDVVTQLASVAQLEATLPPLRQQLAQTRDQLAVLAGVAPNSPLPEFYLEQYKLPNELPVSFPSALLEQRPDVRAAQAQIKSASAQVGVAIANRLPNLQLSATPGEVMDKMHDFFRPGYGNWTLSATLMQPIFQGGSLLHAERQAKDNLLQAKDNYEATVISAIQDVADTLYALKYDADTLEANQTNYDAAGRSLKIVKGQLRLGDVSELTVLQAQQAYAQARLSLVQAQSARFSDSVALFQSLGGGWWNRNDLGMSPKDQEKLGKSLWPW
ncbi:efflux transporter outer membrane subunit [Swingsia samuiensis]|uniref:Efflux transporter outer membrane subunit n=1 Tax=Swingsia samuiensis TaxID=1293412 RepID=A0A4Y6UKE6_9PROT|nr:efflux transporter outer membrane subunit [Swingsia samuiensis]QDH16857.1 efflux transporter outer membrane subunit [Swingsia samuiensis]